MYSSFVEHVQPMQKSDANERLTYRLQPRNIRQTMLLPRRTSPHLASTSPTAGLLGGTLIPRLAKSVPALYPITDVSNLEGATWRSFQLIQLSTVLRRVAYVEGAHLSLRAQVLIWETLR